MRNWRDLEMSAPEMTYGPNVYDGITSVRSRIRRGNATRVDAAVGHAGATPVVSLADKTVVITPQTEARTTLIEPNRHADDATRHGASVFVAYPIFGVVALALFATAFLLHQRIHPLTLARYGKFHTVVSANRITRNGQRGRA
ncbi:MAG: hypothetical protein DMF56_09650 [Acidobacteria bacterium]|nr:MAG: hypothetical protein DMF56_09650 [Acidobacteriota bacterium]